MSSSKKPFSIYIRVIAKHMGFMIDKDHCVWL